MAHYPGVALSEASQNAYATALMPSPQAGHAGGPRVARREERFPSVAALLRGIGEVISGAPSAEDAWAEVRASFPLHYCFTTAVTTAAGSRRTPWSGGPSKPRLPQPCCTARTRAPTVPVHPHLQRVPHPSRAEGRLRLPARACRREGHQIGERADTPDAGGPRSGIAASMKASTT
jgi:hypothetical protein